MLSAGIVPGGGFVRLHGSNLRRAPVLGSITSLLHGTVPETGPGPIWCAIWTRHLGIFTAQWTGLTRPIRRRWRTAVEGSIRRYVHVRQSGGNAIVGIDLGLPDVCFTTFGRKLPASSNLFRICKGRSNPSWPLARRNLCAKTYLALSSLGRAGF